MPTIAPSGRLLIQSQMTIAYAPTLILEKWALTQTHRVEHKTAPGPAMNKTFSNSAANMPGDCAANRWCRSFPRKQVPRHESPSQMALPEIGTTASQFRDNLSPLQLPSPRGIAL